MAQSLPHVLVLMSDEHCPQVTGCYGDPLVRTPNLDRLAASGTLFERAYCNNPICVPGRYSILTGRLPREIGSTRFDHGLDPGQLTYPRHFAEHGYQTTCVGKMHFQGLEQMHGWMSRPFGDMDVLNHAKLPGHRGPQRPPDVPHTLSDWVAQARPGMDGFITFDEHVTAVARTTLLDYFRQLCNPRRSHTTRPLLCQVSWKTPHWPFWAPPEYFNHYIQHIGLPEIPPPDPGDEHPWMTHKHKWEQPYANTDEQIRRARAAYWGLVQYVDRQVGLVLGVLDELGLRDQFLIVYHSDHGEMAGNHGSWGKGCMYEHSVRVPLIFSWPGRIPQGRRVRENVSNLDLFPTLCDYCGLETPRALSGDSLRPLIDGDAAAADRFGQRAIISEFFQAGHDPQVMALRGDVKFISHGAKYPAQMFDLAADPHELRNAAEDAAYADRRAELQTVIDALPQPYRWNEPAAAAGGA